MQTSLASRPVALVTGAARRMGAAIAKALHQAGFRVVVHCHSAQEAAAALVAGCNLQRTHSALLARADFCEPLAVQSLIDTVLSWAGRLDVLVNNASIFSKQDKDWAAMFACNVYAPYCLSRASYPYLAKNAGSIINITDFHTHKPLRGYAAYCQSKAALAMQTRALAQEFAPRVRVNAIAPGAIIWPEGDNQLQEDLRARIMANTYLKRHGDPRYITQAVLYLLQNDFVTGQSLGVDGGRQ